METPTTYTVTAWDIYNLATHKATRDKNHGSEYQFWTEVALTIQYLTRDFHISEQSKNSEAPHAE